MKNKRYLLLFSLLCTAQIASCMDEQQIVPLQGSITFDENIDKICAKYFSDSLRELSNTHLGTTIKKETPCIWANFVIKNKCPQYQAASRICHTKFAGAIPLEVLITDADKIILPKVHLKHEKSYEQLISIVQKAKENFEESKYFFAFSPSEIGSVFLQNRMPMLLQMQTCRSHFASFSLQQMKEQIQYYIDKEIVLEKPEKIIGSGASIPAIFYEHGLHGFGSPMQGQKGNIAKLLMQREKTGSFRK